MKREDLRHSRAINSQDQHDEDAEVVEQTRHSSPLPSRSEIHQHKRQKHKWKLKYPVIKLLALFFVLLPIVIYSWLTFIENQKGNKALQAGGESGGYETVGINNNQGKNTSYDVRDVDEKKTTENEINDNNQKEEQNNVQRDDDSINSTQQKEQIGQGEGTVGKDQQELEQPKTDPNKQAETTKPVESSNIVYHTVKPNETLYRISMNYFQSQAGIDIIKNANGLANNEIRVGQVLKIPINK